MSTRGEQLRDEAIARVWRNADARWKAAAAQAVRLVAARGLPFTTDDVWVRLTPWSLRTGITPRERRAMGAVVQGALRRGEIRATGEYRRSQRPECHARPIPVYERGAR
jgi:hypothetical protein